MVSYHYDVFSKRVAKAKTERAVVDLWIKRAGRSNMRAGINGYGTHEVP